MNNTKHIGWIKKYDQPIKDKGLTLGHTCMCEGGIWSYRNLATKYWLRIYAKGIFSINEGRYNGKRIISGDLTQNHEELFSKIRAYFPSI